MLAPASQADSTGPARTKFLLAHKEPDSCRSADEAKRQTKKQNSCLVFRQTLAKDMPNRPHETRFY